MEEDCAKFFNLDNLVHNYSTLLYYSDSNWHKYIEAEEDCNVESNIGREFFVISFEETFE